MSQTYFNFNENIGTKKVILKATLRLIFMDIEVRNIISFNFTDFKKKIEIGSVEITPCSMSPVL